jgi:hypothetical protein
MNLVQVLRELDFGHKLVVGVPWGEEDMQASWQS